MTYYIMTEENYYEFIAIKNTYWDTYLEIQREVFTANDFDYKGWSYNDRQANPEGFRQYRVKQARVEKEVKTANISNYDAYLYKMAKCLIKCICPDGKVKKDVIADSARKLDLTDIENARIVNIGKARDTGVHSINQYWIIFKENGKWFFKMDETCKTKHEIVL